MHLMPLYEKILIKMPNAQELTSETGITFTRDLSKNTNTTLEGEVVAVGKGRLLSDGTIVPMTVKVGDRIVFSKMQGESYNDGKQDYTILSEANVLAIVKED